MNLRKILILMYLISGASLASAQKQLVLLHGQKVIKRFNAGDEFVIALKDEKRKMVSYINNVFDTAVVVHKTLVPLHKINRVYFKQSGFVNLVGNFLVVAGAGYFLIDQLNVVVVNGDEASLNDNVTTASVAMVAAGLPMMLIKKKSQRIGGRYRLIAVEDGSPFYLQPLNRQ